MSLADVRLWVFDMDGTLTVAVHDFAAIRQALEMPLEERRARYIRMMRVLRSQDINAWAADFLEALEQPAARRSSTSMRARLSWMRTRTWRKP